MLQSTVKRLAASLAAGRKYIINVKTETSDLLYSQSTVTTNNNADINTIYNLFIYVKLFFEI